MPTEHAQLSPLLPAGRSEPPLLDSQVAAGAAACQQPMLTGGMVPAGSSEPLLHDGRLKEILGHDVLPVFRLVHAQLAASLATLAKFIRAHPGGQKVKLHSVVPGRVQGWAPLKRAAAIPARADHDHWLMHN